MAFKSVEKKQQGLGGDKVGGKFFFYGFTGCGKTCSALTFPNSCIIDSETGASFYLGQDIKIGNNTYNNVKFVDTTANLEDLEDDLQSVIDGELEGVETVIIDSESKFYASMDIASTEAEERRAKNRGKEVDTRAKWGRVKNINTRMSALKISASANGYHVVSIAQAKEVEDEKTKDKYITHEGHKSLRFDYDVVVFFHSKVNKQTKEVEYYGEIEKDRTGVTKVGDVIKNISFDIWKPYFDNRSGLELSNVNLLDDIKSSEKAVLTDSEKAEGLAEELKILIKSATNKTPIKKKLDELKIDIKSLATTEPKLLVEAIRFIKTL